MNSTRSGSKSYSHGANQTFTQGFPISNANDVSEVVSSKKRMKQIRKENGWDQYIKPISKYNEQVHPSMKISFERI